MHRHEGHGYRLRGQDSLSAIDRYADSSPANTFMVDIENTNHSTCFELNVILYLICETIPYSIPDKMYLAFSNAGFNTNLWLELCMKVKYFI